MTVDISTDSYYKKEAIMQIREQIKLVNIALSGTLDLYRIWAKKHQLNYNALVILYTLNDYKKNYTRLFFS